MTQLANQKSLDTTHIQSAGGNHRSVIFRCDNQPTIIVQWSSGATTQPATTSIIVLDLSGATTQSTDHNASSTRASIKFRLNMPMTQLANQKSLHITHIQSAGGNHRSVIFRCDNQPTIIVQWSSGATTQPATTSMIVLDLSGATTQSTDHNASSTRASIKFRLNILKPRSLKQLPQLYRALSSSKSKLRSVRNHLPKAAQERKNHWTTIARISNSATTSRSLNTPIQVSKLVSIESPKEDELSATNLAPNGGVNRRQSQEIGFE
ncbi:hypothetical protein F511_32550 [Dorcoceras hygrometricum]|uniref:Uncharacterized protein n=1 Tax=Dorcoceras hygrometricum TaxID=472368 RepID=A0A2Z7C1N0_9LAMI|nr:hypothetical protein F511_32550 [Dorcoceras hygrometricum]